MTTGFLLGVGTTILAAAILAAGVWIGVKIGQRIPKQP